MSASDSYSQFLRRKLSVVPRTGIAGEIRADGSLFDHQRALTNWALRRGSAAIFADTGLGKMRMELAWSDVVHKHTRMPVMIHTPLAVAPQLAAEAALMGIDAKVCRGAADLIDGINITNYDRLHLRALGVELKASYYQQAVRNMQAMSSQGSLFGAIEAEQSAVVEQAKAA